MGYPAEIRLAAAFSGHHLKFRICPKHLMREATSVLQRAERPAQDSGEAFEEFRRDRLKFFLRCAQTSDAIPFKFGPDNVLVISRPDLVNDVLVAHRTDFSKAYLTSLMHPLLANSLLLADSDSWLHQRKLVLPAFHADRLKNYGAVMAEEASRAASQWTGGAVRDVHSDMMHMTLQIVTGTLFGIDLEKAVGAAEELVSTLMDEFNARIAMPVRSRFPLPTLRTVRLIRAMRELDGIAYRAIRERRANPGGDLLSMLVTAHDEDGKPMSDREVRNAAVAVFFAGHETTACLLSWTLYALAGHPDVESQVVAEMAREDAPNGDPAALVERLPYLQAVLNEVLRLYPPAYGFGRRAVRDTFVGDRRVPAGTTVLMSPWAMHRDPRHFADPERFDPTRWRNGLASKLPRFAYFPFSSGPRRCVGSSYAMMEATIALATFLPRYRLARTGEVEAAPSMTLRPGGGMPMSVHPRTEVAGAKAS